jgi:hypothetical protein
LFLLSLALACAPRAPSPAGTFAAGPVARGHGVEGYQVLAADAHHLDVRWLGRTAGHLRVEVQGGSATQRLEAPEEAFTLFTSRDRIAMDLDGTRRVLAERTGDGWVERERPARGASSDRWLPTLLAVDIDLAVQGTSMIFEGKVYAPCTGECIKAERCVRESPLPRCAAGVTTCGACLEQEP